MSMLFSQWKSYTKSINNLEREINEKRTLKACLQHEDKKVKSFHIEYFKGIYKKSSVLLLHPLKA